MGNACVARKAICHSEFFKISFPSKIIVEEAVDIIKKRAREKTFLISKIYSKEIISIRMRNPNVCTGFYLSALSSIDSTLYDHRAKNYPASPKNFNDLLFIGNMGSNET